MRGPVVTQPSPGEDGPKARPQSTVAEGDGLIYLEKESLTIPVYVVTEVAERYGVSRKTVHKWLGRYRGGGVTSAPEPCPLCRESTWNGCPVCGRDEGQDGQGPIEIKDWSSAD